MKFFWCVHCVYSLCSHHIVIALLSCYFKFLFTFHATIGLIGIIVMVTFIVAHYIVDLPKNKPSLYSL
jgi:hypothetical protein